MPTTPPSSSTPFDERLWPSPATWLLAPGLGLGIGIATVPFGWSAAAALGVLTTVAVAALLAAASPRVRVTDDVLQAGRARVPLALLGAPEAFTGEEARQERGPRLDARAYLLLRGWVDPVVRVPLEDPGDPTPYWLVSTRRPEELLDALRRTRCR